MFDKIMGTLLVLLVVLSMAAFFLDGWGVVEFRPFDNPYDENAELAQELQENQRDHYRQLEHILDQCKYYC
jgi:hypothetical protein